MLKFLWDENKNQTNIKKHGISFEEASSVFYDDDSLIIQDEFHEKDNEERFVLIGFSYKANILVVCHCYRNEESVIRIISARKADKKERNVYLNKK